jgi:hypothetical protein
MSSNHNAQSQNRRKTPEPLARTIEITKSYRFVNVHTETVRDEEHIIVRFDMSDGCRHVPYIATELVENEGFAISCKQPTDALTLYYPMR